MNGDEEVITVVKFTDFCPCCENAIMVTDGDLEWCELCQYSRDYDGDYFGEGLA